MSRRFHIVDVFAQRKYSGNQLAVVTDAADLDTAEMQQIAAEMNYSETTFVTGPEREGSWPVRIFTPTDEVPFAGHPTLGTAAVIRQQLTEGTPEAVTLDLEVGEIPVEACERDGRETLWMRQRAPEFGEELPHDDLAEVLGLPRSALDDEWPVQVVSTGLPTIIVPLVDRAALTAIDLDREAYDDLVEGREAKLVHTICPDPRDADNDFAVRMFAPALGVLEDPATGSANGCFAAYLAEHEYTGSPRVAARVEQGYEIDRPSLLYLDSDASGEGVEVEVGGAVVAVAEGDLL